ncbi:hypothetical protein BCY84_06004 [Trypanosoma cruzi cruzi]|nr:hypothetical protein BCY84_06004 [Trypanosoma cruzi cruzi]
MRRGVASWMDEGPLLRVALWVISCFVCDICLLRGCGRVPLAVGLNWRRWRCVRLLCGGPNPLTRGLTALRWCLCVCVRAGAGDAPLCCSFRIVLCPALCVGALLWSPRTCLMYCRCCCPLHFLNTR